MLTNYEVLNRYALNVGLRNNDMKKCISIIKQKISPEIVDNFLKSPYITQEDKSDIDNLPPEIVENILEHMSFIDIMNLCSTNKRMTSICTNYYNLETNLIRTVREIFNSIIKGRKIRLLSMEFDNLDRHAILEIVKKVTTEHGGKEKPITYNFSEEKPREYIIDIIDIINSINVIGILHYFDGSIFSPIVNNNVFIFGKYNDKYILIIIKSIYEVFVNMLSESNPFLFLKKMVDLISG